MLKEAGASEAKNNGSVWLLVHFETREKNIYLLFATVRGDQDPRATRSFTKLSLKLFP